MLAGSYTEPKFKIKVIFATFRDLQKILILKFTLFSMCSIYLRQTNLHGLS